MQAELYILLLCSSMATWFHLLLLLSPCVQLSVNGYPLVPYFEVPLDYISCQTGMHVCMFFLVSVGLSFSLKLGVVTYCFFVEATQILDAVWH